MVLAAGRGLVAYRSEQEVKDAWAREPLRRMKAYLMSLNAWSDDEENTWKEQCARYVDGEVNDHLEKALRCGSQQGVGVEVLRAGVL